MSNYGPPGGSPHSPEPWSGGTDPDPYEVPSDPWGEAEQARDQNWGTGQQQWDGPGGWSPGQDQGIGQDQWSGQDRWGGQPTSTPPDGTGSPAGRPDPDSTERHGIPAVGAAMPGPPGADPHTNWPTGGHPVKGGRTGAVVILTILAVLVLGSGGLAIYLVGRSDPGAGSPVGTAATSEPTGTPAATLDGTTGPSGGAAPGQPTPGPQTSADARFVAVGQCVVNEGTVEKPQLAITDCESGSLEVLHRVDGATTGEEDAKSKCSQVAGYTTWYFFDSPFDALDYVLCLKLR
nr:flagellar basal body protein FliL [Micromonospora sp. DSM 115978]